MESVLKVRIQTKYEHDVEEVRGVIIVWKLLLLYCR